MKLHTKEIYLQPESFEAVNETLEDIYGVLDKVFAEDYDELIFTGCGTSLYLAQAAAHAFSSYNAIPSKSGMLFGALLFPGDVCEKPEGACPSDYEEELHDGSAHGDR